MQQFYFAITSFDYPNPQISNKLHLLALLNITQSFRHRAEVIVAIAVIPPPTREGLRTSSSAKHSERQDEQRQQTSTIHSTSQQVRVVLENTRAVVAKVELREEASDKLTEDDASLGLVVRDITSIGDELRHVDVVGGEFADLGDEL